MKPGRPSDSQRKPRKTSALLISEAKGTQQQRNAALQGSTFLPRPGVPSPREGGQHIPARQLVPEVVSRPYIRTKWPPQNSTPFLQACMEPRSHHRFPAGSPQYRAADPREERPAGDVSPAIWQWKIRLALEPSLTAAGSAGHLLSCPPWKA